MNSRLRARSRLSQGTPYPTQPWSCSKMARLRRLTWLGKVLNRDSESVVTQFILAEANRYNGSEDGHIFNDVPSFTNSEELVSLAQDTDKWSEILGKV